MQMLICENNDCKGKIDDFCFFGGGQSGVIGFGDFGF